MSSEPHTVLIAIADRRAEIRRERDRLDIEDRELEAAERQITRLFSMQVAAPNSALASHDAVHVGEATQPIIEKLATGRRKPRGVPKVLVMVFEILRETKRPMQAKEIADQIRDRWWREAPTSAIQAQLWRAAKDGRLQKCDRGYSLPPLPTYPRLAMRVPNAEGPRVDARGPSLSNGEEAPVGRPASFA